MKYQKDSLNKIKNYNYFKKGLYLYEYFNDFSTSENSLLKVDPNMVSENDYLQSRYYLYKIYSSPEFKNVEKSKGCLLYTSPSPRDRSLSRMPSSA